MAPIRVGPGSLLRLLPTFLLLLLLPLPATARSEKRIPAKERLLEKYNYFSSKHQGVILAESSGVLRASHGRSEPSVGQPLSRLPWCAVHDAQIRTAQKDHAGAQFTGEKAKGKRKRRYLPQRDKWHKRHLTYRLVNWPRYLPQPQVRQAVRAAFELWSNVSALVFWEATGDFADIRLTFFHGDHNDGAENAFDGPGGALAHAFFPRRSEAHFDNDERWSLGSGKGRNLFVVVAHEIGHTLGLEHSPVRNALMSPYYKKLGKEFVLNWDDILAIQNLYGKPARGSVVQLPGKLFTHFQDLSTGLDREGNSSLHYCWSFFDAITADLEDNIYIFKGGYYWVILKGGKSSGPHPLRNRWPELPSTIDAAAFSGEDGKFYFFRGGRCWRYKDSSLEIGFPQKCSSRGDLPRHPDTALYFQPLHHLVLFKGPKYYVVEEETLQVEPYYPRSLRDWVGVPAMANGALPRQDGFVYFFRDDHFWKFNPEKLRVVETGKWALQLGWLGCQDTKLHQALV